MLRSLREERHAFEKHRELLEHQNGQLIGELDQQAKKSDDLQRKMTEKRDRVTQLKDKMQKSGEATPGTGFKDSRASPLR